MNKCQTDNSFFTDKVNLRLRHLPDKKHIRVLEAYCGDGKIWNEIKTKTNKQIDILRVDKKENSKGVYLIGDNRKYLMSLNLGQYDIIDLDAYGVPFSQLEIIFDYFDKINNTRGVVCFVTFIQTMFGCLPKKMLYSVGYSRAMIEKCPALFYMKGFEKFKRYLYLRGVRHISSMSAGRKHYLYFKINGEGK